MADARSRLYIEANAVCAPHQSGVGHAAHGLITALMHDSDAQRRLRVVLIVPLRGAPALQRRGLGNVPRVTMPLPLRGYDRWSGMPVLPPLDALLGRGVYLFPNFGNWPLWRSPSLTVIHDLVFLRHPDTVERRTGARLRAGAQRWIRRSSLVLTPSEFSRQELIDALDVEPARVVVMPLGVDQTVFSPRPAEEVNATLGRLGLAPGYVLFLGNIEPRKNLARLVRAYGLLTPALKREHPLVLAGGSSWRAEGIESALASARERGDPVVRVPGRLGDGDLPALISGAAMLAHPALYEGFGLVPLQAMACGTPVLVSNRSAMPEVVGDAGLYVDPLREDTITEALHTMLSDAGLRASLAVAGRARASTFTWTRSVRQFLAALDSLGI